MVTLTIDRGLKDSVYEQVAGQVRQLVASGTLAPGTPLPSVRQLASDVGVNLNTIARAYRLLEAEGFLAIKDRAGVFVAAPAVRAKTTVKKELQNQLSVTIARLRQAGVSHDELLALVEREVSVISDQPPEASK